MKNATTKKLKLSTHFHSPKAGICGGREENCHSEETDTEQTGSLTALYNYKAYEEDEQTKAMMKKKKPTLRTHVHPSYKAFVNRQMP